MYGKPRLLDLWFLKVDRAIPVSCAASFSVKYLILSFIASPFLLVNSLTMGKGKIRKDSYFLEVGNMGKGGIFLKKFISGMWQNILIHEGYNIRAESSACEPIRAAIASFLHFIFVDNPNFSF